MLTRPTLRGAVIRMVVLALACGWGLMQAGAVSKVRSRPIVADLVADPDSYFGKPVIIYGQVIKSDFSAGFFMLEDVSQHPLRIDARDLPPVRVGDQLLVVGTLERTKAGLSLLGKHLRPVRVLAGGGCC